MLKKLIMTGVLACSLLATQLTTFGQWLPNDLLYQNTFDEGVGLPWHIVETIPSKVEFDISGGTYNIKVLSKSKERWDIQFRHRGLSMQAGHEYTVKFKVKASKSCSIYAKIGDQKDPYYEDWNYNNRSWSLIPLTANEVKSVEETFISTRNADMCEFSFHLNDSTVPIGTEFSFDDMYLHDPLFTKPSPVVTPIPRNIRTNHLGYFINSEKKATFPSQSTTPVDWTLEDSNNNIVASGKSTVFGADKDSGETVHTIDFSSYNTPGNGYILRTSMEDDLGAYEKPVENISFPFDISNDIYKDLKYDALKFFYHQRSGIEIELPFAVKEEWVRPAGHPKDIAKAVSERGYISDHSLDVSGGWYDAGDFGKYVSNAGISVWTLMNMYERANVNIVKGDKTAMNAIDDDTMNIPESKNGIPDIIDEARWEMEFMLKMQIPAGKPKAGMVHHKMHDVVWLGLAVAPHEDPYYPHDRILKPPTTSATLNLAAAGAQSYRIWKDIDKEFADTCLAAAETAWKAALENPDMVAPFDDNIGGGPYGDDYFEDEFYWSAAELFISTGKFEYLNYLKGSKHYLEMPTRFTNGESLGTVGCFDWANTAGLGTISLALVNNNLPSEDINIAKTNIMKAADHFIQIQDNQGYGITINQSPLNENVTGYPWGSNSFVLNQCILFGYAYDFSKNTKYFNAATEAMDYILGRNPLSKSYVSGYGENCLENPHHRFFSYQANPEYPKCPPGFVAGGPNSILEDPWVKPAVWDPRPHIPQKSYIDHIESWSTNEVVINWNAPLAWTTAYLDEVGKDIVPVSPKKGDVNGDGLINSLDAALMKRMILNIPNNGNKYAADINQDSYVNSVDLAQLKRHIIGIKIIQ